MQQNNPETPSPDEMKRHLEAAAGRPLDISPSELIKLRYPVGSFVFFGADEGSSSTWQHIFLPGKNCLSDSVIDVCGVSTTIGDGKRVLRLSDFVCVDNLIVHEPTNVVVTPLSGKPFFVTMIYSLVPFPGNIDKDVEITVFSWDPNGAAAPNVPFHWRCRVAITEIF